MKYRSTLVADDSASETKKKTSKRIIPNSASLHCEFMKTRRASVGTKNSHLLSLCCLTDCCLSSNEERELNNSNDSGTEKKENSFIKFHNIDWRLCALA